MMGATSGRSPAAPSSARAIVFYVYLILQLDESARERPADRHESVVSQGPPGPTYSKIFTLGNCFFKAVKVYKLSELWTSS
jgi:hypothetical protein